MLETIAIGKLSACYGVPEVPANLVENAVRTGALIGANERIANAQDDHDTAVNNIVLEKAKPPPPKAPGIRPIALPKQSCNYMPHAKAVMCDWIKVPPPQPFFSSGPQAAVLQGYRAAKARGPPPDDRVALRAEVDATVNAVMPKAKAAAIQAGDAMSHPRPPRHQLTQDPRGTKCREVRSLWKKERPPPAFYRSGSRLPPSHKIKDHHCKH